MFYNSYSYDIQKAYDNVGVQAYLKEIWKEDADFYSGFVNLAKHSRQECLVRVGSCDFVGRPCFSRQKERSTKPHELNTKLVTTEIDF